MNAIVVEAGGVRVDGTLIPGHRILENPVIRRSGPTTLGPSITLTIYADTVTISDAAKALGRNVIEIHGDQA
ncbi:hypothetical protein [Leucobacter sp. G161]|uniref:hypothetical protein n=1 Tax=Leucobacter sp. G161 TaxID=663704 RepID=UPI00073B6124|nr:hypothetical protein [Leucobacter sp. G161]KUF07179.1 hypothetical protein AUL38_02510 [Leucobacter sp. G161]